jgi:hypothetical protein
MDYITITFGPANDPRNGYYNQKERFNSKRAAIRKGLDSLCIGGCTGYVVIEEGDDFWEIIDECGTKNMSIGYKNYTYFVQPAPKLQLV